MFVTFFQERRLSIALIKLNFVYSYLRNIINRYRTKIIIKRLMNKLQLISSNVKLFNSFLLIKINFLW